MSKKSNNDKAVLFSELFEMSGIKEDACNISVGSGSLVFLKEQMTAIETMMAIKHLNEITVDMLTSLRRANDEIKRCSHDFPYVGRILGYIDIPPSIRRECGIPQDVKMRVALDAKNGPFTMMEDRPELDIRDVPKDIINLVRSTGIEIDDLVLLADSRATVYDGESYHKENEEDGENE